MKKILLLPATILLLLAHQLGAQPKYRYTANLDAYVGTWVYQNADTTFTLVIKKGTQSTSLFHSDCLIGGYKLEKGGFVLADYTQNIPSEFTEDSYSPSNFPAFWGDNGRSKPEKVNPNKVEIYFLDNSGLLLNGMFILKSPTTANFTVWKQERVVLLEEGQTYEDPDISVPEDVIMTKVE